MRTRDDAIEIAADRFERRLAGELGKLRAEFHAGLHSEIGKLRAEMGAFEGRITRWMFVFWVGQIGVILGILLAFFQP